MGWWLTPIVVVDKHAKLSRDDDCVSHRDAAVTTRQKRKMKKVGDVTFGATNYRFFFMRHGCDGKYGEDPILHLQVAKGKKTHDFHKTSQNKKNQTKNYNLMG